MENELFGVEVDVAQDITISVVIEGVPHDLLWRDIALPGDDLARIPDDDLVARCERWIDLEAGTLNGYIVRREDTGIVVRRKATFGATR